MKASAEAISMIKEFEGCKLTAYQCAAGKFTIGYGHTGADVASGMTITQARAEQLLAEDVQRFEHAVNNLVKVALTQQQFDALVSWTYNLGPGNLAESTLLRVLNDGNYDEVPAQMQRWVYSQKKVLSGLVKRRAEEAALFTRTDAKASLRI